jgi:hypothetical protein
MVKWEDVFWGSFEPRLCYIVQMSQSMKDILQRVETWPPEDQEEFAELAREIEARRSGVYVLDHHEEAAIRQGIAELDRGDWLDEKAMRAFWKRCGII